MKAPKNKFFWLYFLWIYPFLLFGKNLQPLVIKDNNWFDIPQYADVWADKTCLLTVDCFLEQPQRFKFKTNDEKQIFGFPGAVYWLRFTIRNEDSLPRQRFIVVNKKEIDKVQLFLTVDNRVVDSVLTGACLNYSERPYPNQKLWLPVSLKPKATYTVYLALDNRYDFLSTTIHYQKENLRDNLTEESVRSFMSGMAAFYLLSALGLFVYVRQRLFFYYLVYVIGGVGYLISTTGFGITMLWQNAPQFDSISSNVLGTLSILGFILMSRRFLETPIYFKKSDFILRGGIVSSVLVILTGFSKQFLCNYLYFYTCMIGVLVFLFVVSTLLFVSIQTFRQFKRREVGLFLFSFSLYLLNGLLAMGYELGFIKYKGLWFQNLLEALPLFSFFFEMTVLSIILVYRLRKEWAEQELKTIAFQKTATHQRERISRDLHDDIGSTLNSISVYSEIVRRQIHQISPESEIILENIGESARQLMGSMNDIVWSINPDNDHFENITQRMRLFVAQIIMSQKITLQFWADPKLNDVVLSIEKRKNFYLIFKEAVNNVHKYAQCQTLNIHIQAQNGSIEMTITDDGCGFNTQTTQTGNGLKNMQHRANELNGTLSIHSEIKKGTVLNLCFPVKE